MKTNVSLSLGILSNGVKLSSITWENKDKPLWSTVSFRIWVTCPADLQWTLITPSVQRLAWTTGLSTRASCPFEQRGPQQAFLLFSKMRQYISLHSINFLNNYCSYCKTDSSHLEELQLLCTSFHHLRDACAFMTNTSQCPINHQRGP